MQPPFVKKFDFRGIYNQDITDKDAYFIALAVAKTIPLKRVLVGWDTRKSSESLAYNFMEALRGKGIEINFLEKCPIDYVTTAANAFPFDFAVMFTGSHNPWNWTGLLMHTAGGESVQGELVNEIIENYNAVLTVPYVNPEIDLADTAFIDFQPIIEAAYIRKAQELIPFDDIKEMRVLVDVGDGSGSKSLTLLSRYLPQVVFQRINDRELYDEHSAHTADPSNPENMAQLSEELKKADYTCGFAFDSDSDRVLAMDEHGDYINGSLIGSALMETFAKLHTGINIYGYAVECGPSLYNTAIDLKAAGEPIEVKPVPVGRSLLRHLVRDDSVDIAVENVGHFYIKEFFKTDSGVFSLLVILYWISVFGPLSSLKQKHPDGQRVQFSQPIVDNQEQVLKDLINDLNAGMEGESKYLNIDGHRYEFYREGKLISWYAMRPSGYEKIEKYYFGSLDEKEFAYLQTKIKKTEK